MSISTQGLLVLLVLHLWLVGCQPKNNASNNTMLDLTSETPGNSPVEFLPDLVAKDQLIHRGVLSPDLKEYYFTVSDTQYRQFDVKMVQKTSQGWSSPKNAFFNSAYNEHGMSFSSDGRYLYFSSTRPVNTVDVADTWHIWRSQKQGNTWSSPAFVDIPNLRNKLLSHPSISDRGTLYFHVSNLDYSHMAIYTAQQVNNRFEAATKVPLTVDSPTNGFCTPYVSPDGTYLLFAAIREHHLDLMRSRYNKQNGWGVAQKLKANIHHKGQGNPYVSPDGKFLFFAAENDPVKPSQGRWAIKWVQVPE